MSSKQTYSVNFEFNGTAQSAKVSISTSAWAKKTVSYNKTRVTVDSINGSSCLNVFLCGPDAYDAICKLAKDVAMGLAGIKKSIDGNSYVNI